MVTPCNDVKLRNLTQNGMSDLIDYWLHHLSEFVIWKVIDAQRHPHPRSYKGPPLPHAPSQLLRLSIHNSRSTFNIFQLFFFKPFKSNPSK